MWSTVGILLIGIIVWLIEVKPLFKSKNYRVIFVYSFIVIIGLTLSILLVLNITIPTPLDFLNYIYSPVSSLIERFLS
ncbi:hypothetical protein [Metabacillus schmidteae]|uniref:hypothetical protein n=1 Tax=Metabacillus schmidteae TaxID=2730405 RepID=UPI00158BFD5F|nr:hypothetical protein [Metabacillus schmidteae]